MSSAKIPEADFIRLYPLIGPAGLAEQYNVTERRVFERRRRLEAKLGMRLRAPANAETPEHPGRLKIEVENGTVLVGSDAHYWPGRISTAHRAFVQMCKKLKPEVVILNGDVFDGATVSRHPPINWEQRPSVALEIEACKDRLGEIEKAAGKALRVWTLGNHDARFETCLATRAPEYAKVDGLTLKGHFPLWEPCWSVWINDGTVVKHRNRSGVHAAHNNTVNAGKNVVTGHDHQLKVTPFVDYNGRRYGVSTGTLADPYGPQFEYQEDNPRNHSSGFAVLTFEDGELRWPEVCAVVREGVYEWRGKTYEV